MNSAAICADGGSVSLEPIRSIYEDDPDMLEIVRDFAAALPERRATLMSLLDANNLEALQTVAHQLKGAGGGYGFQAITDAAARLEQAAKEGAEPSVLKDFCQSLCDVLDAVRVPEDA